MLGCTIFPSIMVTLLISYITSLTSNFVPLRLALRGYSVASLPRRFALRASRSHSRSLRSLEIFKKKSVSQSTQNALKRVKIQTNMQVDIQEKWPLSYQIRGLVKIPSLDFHSYTNYNYSSLIWIQKQFSQVKITVDTFFGGIKRFILIKNVIWRLTLRMKT